MIDEDMSADGMVDGRTDEERRQPHEDRTRCRPTANWTPICPGDPHPESADFAADACARAKAREVVRRARILSWRRRPLRPWPRPAPTTFKAATCTVPREDGGPATDGIDGGLMPLEAANSTVDRQSLAHD